MNDQPIPLFRSTYHSKNESKKTRMERNTNDAAAFCDGLVCCKKDTQDIPGEGIPDRYSDRKSRGAEINLPDFQKLESQAETF